MRSRKEHIEKIYEDTYANMLGREIELEHIIDNVLPKIRKSKNKEALEGMVGRKRQVEEEIKERKDLLKMMKKKFLK